MYLSGDAKLWWKGRINDDACAGRSRIETFDVLKKELRDQLLHLNVAWVAKKALKKLKHTGSARLCQEIQFFDVGRKKHVRGRQVV